MKLASTLLCGLLMAASPLLADLRSPEVPYILPLWLAGLLGHRAWRDDQRCREKYGELWTDYCHRVRFRMLPFIY